MFEKILIANRGEIACRAMLTCQKMGIKTVAVCSEPDSKAKHVLMADEVVFLGGSTSAESYLRIDKILDAIEQTQADAVYPGYGFLSENADFARQLAENNITFIGPNVRAIEAMGDKIESKKLAIEAGVNTIPGYTNEIADSAEAVKIAADVGYPVMIKASAGGGGKGMRVAYDEAGCIEGFDRARSEAKSSFGDERIFIEKFIEQPRHIEIQVLADSAGNSVYLNERECSIQRRHQKVLEEAPSPFITPEVRAEMGKQACQLAEAVDYQSAGTVEFIVDKDQQFYFLEMNTRLQVEHPVTEMITGIDLVEQMILIAAGQSLTMQQSDIDINGWSMEARIYAEMPERGFLPSTGTLYIYEEPDLSANIRVDSGVIEGSEVSMFYDPMIAKLIVWGENRNVAIQRLHTALNQYVIFGVGHNSAFLQDVLSNHRFQSGDISTNFIAEEYPDGFETGSLDASDLDNVAMLSVFMAIKQQEKFLHKNAQQTWHRDSELQNHPENQRWIVKIGENYHSLTAIINHIPDAQIDFHLGDGSKHAVSSQWQLGQARLTANIDGQISDWQVRPDQARYRLRHNGIEVMALPMSPLQAKYHALMPERVEADMSKFLQSPMPGKLIHLAVSEGDSVQAGQSLAVIEAMKMENQLSAERAGVIAEIAVGVGENLQADQIIMSFEEAQ